MHEAYNPFISKDTEDTFSNIIYFGNPFHSIFNFKTEGLGNNIFCNNEVSLFGYKNNK